MQICGEKCEMKTQRRRHTRQRAQRRKRFRSIERGFERALELLLPPALSQIEGAFFDDRQPSPVEDTLLIFRLSHGIIEWNIIFETSMTLETTTVSRFPEHHSIRLIRPAGKASPLTLLPRRHTVQVKNNFVL